MKAFCFCAFVCTAAAGLLASQDTRKRTEDFDWKIAQRFDDGRVVIMLTSDEKPMTSGELSAVTGPKFDKPTEMFLAKSLGGMVRANGDWVRSVTGNSAKPGDLWAIDAGRAGWFTTSVGESVLATSHCQALPAMLASVDPSQHESFARIREKYFPAHSIGSWTPPDRASRVGPMAHVVTPAERQEIERLLQREFQQKAGAEISRKARIRFDVQAFRLTPDGAARLFVRAGWALDGKSVFLMGAWMRTAPALQIESADFHAADFAQNTAFRFDGPMDPMMNGQVLNVTDIDRDGLAEMLMLYHYYEGFSVELVTYPPAEPNSAKVLAKFGSGC